MNFAPYRVIANLTSLGNAPVKTYRRNSGDRTAAVYAAAHYARKQKTTMIVVGGSSYGAAAYHILRADDDLKKVTVGHKNDFPAVSVTPEGVVSMAVVNPTKEY